MFGFKIINQYEQGIVFRWGKMLPDVRQPGLTWVNPISDRLRKVNMQIIAATVPGQEGITRDNVTVRVDAVVYYRVIDPGKAIINVQNYTYAVAQVAQTSLRSVIGQSDLDQLLSEREKVNAHVRLGFSGHVDGFGAAGGRSHQFGVRRVGQHGGQPVTE